VEFQNITYKYTIFSTQFAALLTFISLNTFLLLFDGVKVVLERDRVDVRAVVECLEN